jgi:hypothetical protein
MNGDSEVLPGSEGVGKPNVHEFSMLIAQILKGLLRGLDFAHEDRISRDKDSKEKSALP